MSEHKAALNEPNGYLVQTRHLISAQEIEVQIPNYPMTPTHFTFSSTFILGLIGLAFHRTHLLSALLCLEGIILSLFIALSV